MTITLHRATDSALMEIKIDLTQQDIAKLVSGDAIRESIYDFEGEEKTEIQRLIIKGNFISSKR